MIQDLKDFMEKIKEDAALRERMGKIVRESDPEKVFDNCNAVAAEMGYAITQEDLQAYADDCEEDLSDEELDKVAGGTIGTDFPIDNIMHQEFRRQVMKGTDK